MPINFASLTASGSTPQDSGTPLATEIRTETGDVSVDLSKGVIVDLGKAEPGLKKVMFAAQWDAVESGSPIDVDISALCVNAKGKITSGEDVIYFNHRNVNGISLSEDNQTGAGDGDDETLSIILDQVDRKYHEIIFVANIFEAVKRKQTFGMVNSCVRLLNMDDNNREICRFSLKDDCSSATGVIVGKMTNNNGSWSFTPIGEGKVVKDLNDILALYS